MLTAMWMVELDCEQTSVMPHLTPQGKQEIVPSSMEWRSLRELVSNQHQFLFLQPVADVFQRLLDHAV